jgi:hypothetical protein
VNLYIDTTATDLTAAAVVSAANLTPIDTTNDLPPFVLGRTEPIEVEFLTGANAYASWSTDATYVVSVALGEQTVDGSQNYVEVNLDTATEHGKSGYLACTTATLYSALYNVLVGRPRASAALFVLEVNVLGPDGGRRTYAQLPVRLNALVKRTGVPSATPPDDYYTTTESDARFQPLKAALTAIGALTPAADKIAYFTGSATAALATITTYGRSLIAAVDAAAAKVLLALTKADVGLGNVDDTSDANKPISTATQTALNLKVPTTRTISTTAPLSGGGDLSADRTLSVTAATTTATGVVELATTAEALAGASSTLVPPVSAVEARVLMGSAGRALRDVCISDGATANRRIEHTPGTAMAGGLPLTILAVIPEVPTSNPSTIAHICAITASGTTDATSSPNSFTAHISTGGSLFLRQNGATSSDNRLFSYSGFRAAYSGRKNLSIAITWANGDTTTNPVIFIDGVDVSALFTSTTGGTAPNWLPPTLDTTKLVVGYNWPAGRVPLVEIGLGSMSAAEVPTWTQTGLKPTWWELGTGSAVAISYTNGSFENDTASPPASWTASGNHVATAVVDGTAPAGSNVLEVVASAAGSYAGGNDNIQQGKPVTVVGRKYCFECWAKSISGNTSLGIGIGGGDALSRDVVTITGTWMKFSGEFVSVNSGGITRIALAGAGTVRLDQVRIIPLGHVIKPVLQPGVPIVIDSGTNMIAGLLTPGMTVPGNKPSIVEIPIPTMSADGFIFADQIITPEGYELFAATIQRVSGSGTGTVTIRETSSGGTVLATGALGATPTALTLSNVFSGGNKKLHLANSSWSSSSLKGRLLFRRYQ